MSLDRGETASTQPAARSDVPAEWDDRTQLTTLLDYARATVHARCAGISEPDARRALLPASPLMTISGLVSHLRWVEHGWFEVGFLGEPYRGLWTKGDPAAPGAPPRRPDRPAARRLRVRLRKEPPDRDVLRPGRSLQEGT